MEWKNKKVLVNGATGFIGSNLIQELLKRGAKIYSIDNFSYTNIELAKKKLSFLKEITIIEGDVSKKENWEKLPSDIEYLFHFSAPSSIILFKKYPEKCWNETVWGLYHALEYSKKNNVKKLIYPSSGAIYSGNEMPHTEKVYPKPRNLYASAKVACEALANSYSDFVKSIGLRIFVGYGPGEERKEDFGSAPYLFIRDLIKGKAPELWGDGNQTRDFVYIDDLVNMIIQSAEIEHTGILNIGTGESYSFRELIQMIKEISDSNAEPTFVPREINYLEHIKADTTLINKLIDIKPTPLREGIKKFIEYLKENYDLDEIN